MGSALTSEKFEPQVTVESDVKGARDLNGTRGQNKCQLWRKGWGCKESLVLELLWSIT